MSDAEAFAAKIRENRNDRTNWLVFADWLQDRDLPLANYCRAQVTVLDSEAGGGGGEFPFDPDRTPECQQAYERLSEVEARTPLEQILWFRWELGEVHYQERIYAICFAGELYQNQVPAFRTLAASIIASVDSFDLTNNPGIESSLQACAFGQIPSADHIEQMILDGQNAGTLPPDATQLLEHFVGAIRQGSVWRYFDGEQARKTSYVNFMHEVFRTYPETLPDEKVLPQGNPFKPPC